MTNMKHWDVPAPYPEARLHLPGNAGTVKGHLVRMERHGGQVWALVHVPAWKRWRSQLAVGEPATEGIAPGVEEVWAPAEAVDVSEEVMGDLRAHRALERLGAA
ncbi:hypothetical protein ACFWFV_13930 [Streptomyces diastaticus]|uniref:hypothetical protein n=1 Tax=Streptomyces diastaticus TaxID=1956 RepID=UPI003658F66F